MVVLYVSTETKWQETVSLGRRWRRRRRWLGVIVGGKVDISAVVVEGGNGVCFCLHFIPFLMVPF